MGSRSARLLRSACRLANCSDCFSLLRARSASLNSCCSYSTSIWLMRSPRSVETWVKNASRMRRTRGGSDVAEAIVAGAVEDVPDDVLNMRYKYSPDAVI